MSPQSSNNSNSIPIRLISFQDIYEESSAHSYYALFTYQPIFFEEAIKHEQWVNSKDEETNSIERNETWDVVDLPKYK